MKPPTTVEAQLLAAGAVLPVGAEVPDARILTTTAVAYTHPGIEGRTVVRLVAEPLVPAEDLTAEVLGFAPRTAEPVPVGVAQAEALGFPAWAVVNDPPNARHALALVKDMEKLARQARVKASAARQGYVDLGQRLARAVPHFLPTYYEEAARAFLAADVAQYAAAFFGRAREAERVYGLPVDEERQHAVFLEFALAGALTAKELTAHGRRLGEQLPAAEALERFTRLCVERTLGGLAPHAALRTDVQRLAQAAGVPAAQADEALLVDVLQAPAVERAPAPFWKAYRAALVRLARADRNVAVRLLDLFPEALDLDTWVSLLVDARVDLLLVGGQGAGGALEPGHPARWLGHCLSRRRGTAGTRSAALVDLVQRMAPRLRHDSVPVPLKDARYVSLDVVDVLLAESVPLSRSDDERIELRAWVDDRAAGARDLLAVAADPVLLPLLVARLEDCVTHTEPGSQESHDAVARIVAVPGLRTALARWFDGFADELHASALCDLDRQWTRFARFALPESLAVAPEAVARIARYDLAAPLTRVFAAGLVDELGWPALEGVLESPVAPAPGGTPTTPAAPDSVWDQWPYLLVRRGMHVTAVGRRGVEAEHLMAVPPSERSYLWALAVRYVDGQFAVSWDRGPDNGLYWTGAPGRVLTVPNHHMRSAPDEGSIPVPGGRSWGGVPLRPGDEQEHGAPGIASDGRDHWTLRTTDDGHGRHHRAWFELDVATGESGRRAAPPFFTRGLADGQHLRASACRLAPAGADFADAPTGWHDGAVGVRVVNGPGDEVEVTSVSGTVVRTTGRALALATPAAVVELPGAEPLLLVRTSVSWRDIGGTIALVTADGTRVGAYTVAARRPGWAAGTAWVAPPDFWTHLQVRDRAGSLALRAATHGQVAELLARTVARAGAAPDPTTMEQRLAHLQERARACLADVVATFPGITHPELLRGVVDTVLRTADMAVDVHRWTTRAAAPETPAEVVAGTPIICPSTAAHGLMSWSYGGAAQASLVWSTLDAALTAPVAPDNVTSVLTSVDKDWFDLPAVVAPLALRLVAPGTPDDHRASIETLLRQVAGTNLLSSGVALRRVELVPDRASSRTWQVGEVLEVRPGQRLLVTSHVVASPTDPAHGLVVAAFEYSKDGTFAPVPGAALRETHEVDLQGVTSQWLTDLLARYAAHGAPAWSPGLVTRLADGACILPAHALALLCGAPQPEVLRAQVAAGGYGEHVPHTDRASVQAALAWLAQGREQLRGDLASLLPDDPGDLWERGPRVDALAGRIVERTGRRLVPPADLVAQVERLGLAAGARTNSFDLVADLLNPDACTWLRAPEHAPDGSFDASHLAPVVDLLLWAASTLPGADPLRAPLARAACLLRQTVHDARASLHIANVDSARLSAEALGRALAQPVTDDGTTAHIGPLVLESHGTWARLSVRPVLVDGPVTALRDAVTALPHTWPLGRTDLSWWATAADEALERAVLGPVGLVGELRDPSLSVPDLVAEVAAARSLGTDAAVLYLQLLALPDPTDRNVAAWTGWRPARLKAARAELLASGLVVEAKRARAGRKLFLPGGWLTLRAPHLPVEQWKVPLLTLDGAQETSPVVVLTRAGVPEVFRQAWQRCVDGDTPGYETLTTGRLR